MTESDLKEKNRRYALGFAIAGSLIIILLMIFINYSSGGRFPWFIFPAYAVLWWPIGVFFAGRNSGKMLSLVGSFITILLLFVTNYLTSWNYPWFLYPSFAILWWPISVFFGSKNGKVFSVIASVIMTVFFVAVNLVTSPSVIWFYYPMFALIWWPLSVFFANPRTIKAYSIIGALVLAGFLTLENILRNPGVPWALFVYFPIAMWPVSVLLNKRMGKLSIALAGSFAGILYYLMLNLFVFQGFAWVIFPAYGLLWWPLVIAFARRGRELIFSIAGSLLTASLLITLNSITTPQSIWAVYPLFAIAWWPLSVYYFIYRRSLI